MAHEPTPETIGELETELRELCRDLGIEGVEFNSALIGSFILDLSNAVLVLLRREANRQSGRLTWDALANREEWGNEDGRA